MDRATVEAKLSELKAQQAQMVKHFDALSGAIQVLEQLLQPSVDLKDLLPGAVITTTDT